MPSGVVTSVNWQRRIVVQSFPGSFHQARTPDGTNGLRRAAGLFSPLLEINTRPKPLARPFEW